MLFEKTFEDKLIETELNTPRTHRTGMSTNRSFTSSSYSGFTNTPFTTNNGYPVVEKLDFNNNLNDTFNDDNMQTGRSLMLTNRTNKSVRFGKNDSTNNDNQGNLDEHKDNRSLHEKAVDERYKTLVELVNTTRKNGELASLSLSLPLTPRSNELPSMENLDESSFITKQMSKSLEIVNDEFNKQFVQEYVNFVAVFQIKV